MAFSDLSEAERQQHFITKANLVGRTIKAVRYMTDEEAEEQGWQAKPAVLELDNGTILFSMMDDEGNDGGCLEVQPKSGGSNGLPVFSL